MAADYKSTFDQIIRASFDEPSQALKTTIESTDMSVELSYADGDSVTAYPVEFASSAIVPNGTATATNVIAAFSIVGIRNIQLVTHTTVNLTATTPSVFVQFSPSDTDDVWVTSALAVTPHATAGNVVEGTALENVFYRRARVHFTHGGYSAGSFTVYCNGRS